MLHFLNFGVKIAVLESKIRENPPFRIYFVSRETKNVFHVKHFFDDFSVSFFRFCGARMFFVHTCCFSLNFVKISFLFPLFLALLYLLGKVLSITFTILFYLACCRMYALFPAPTSRALLPCFLRYSHIFLVCFFRAFFALIFARTRL